MVPMKRYNKNRKLSLQNNNENKKNEKAVSQFLILPFVFFSV